MATSLAGRLWPALTEAEAAAAKLTSTTPLADLVFELRRINFLQGRIGPT